MNSFHANSFTPQNATRYSCFDCHFYSEKVPTLSIAIKKISGSILRLMTYHEKSSLISIGFVPNLLVVAEAKAGFLQLAVLLVAWSCCKWLWCFLAEKEEILSWLRPLGESIKPLGEESDISPEVDEVTVVLVVSLVLREAEPPAEPVPRKTPSKTSSGAARRAWLGRPSPQSESESDESPVKGTERIWLALWKNKQTNNIENE